MSVVDWLATLVARPTVGSAGTAALVSDLAETLVRAGAWVETFPEPGTDKASLLARLGPDGPGGLMLSGHLDVVPVAGQSWSVPPFDLTRQGTRLYGRGTTDMKGFVACILDLATSALEPLDKPLWIALSHDEEIGCVGVRPMLAEIAARGIRPELVLVGEPTSMRLGLGHKGKTTYRATSRGIARHSAEAPLAVNALHALGDLMAGLRALQDDLAANGAREDGYSVPHATVHVGVLNGGTAVNLVPSEATMLFESRYPASEDSKTLDRRIRDLGHALSSPLPANCGLVIEELNAYPGLTTDADTPAVRRLARCLRDSLAEARPCWLSFGTEGGLFAQALDVPVVVCGPGDMAQGHQPDEFIEAAQLDACRQFLEKLTDEFCRDTP